MRKFLTEPEMAQLRAAAACSHADATVISEVAGRKVVRCPDCGCRITTFSPDWRPPAESPSPQSEAKPSASALPPDEPLLPHPTTSKNDGGM